MTARAIDPNNGWVFEDGRWVWEGGSTTGHIEDGTIDGQITTWDVAKTEWTPEGAVVVSGGNAGIGTANPNPSSRLTVMGPSNGTHAIFTGQSDGARGLEINTKLLNANDAHAQLNAPGLSGSNATISLATGGTDRLTIDSSGDATFSGTVHTPAVNLAGGRYVYSNQSGIFLGNNGSNGYVGPSNGSAALANNAIDLGASVGGRWKNAYFSGTVDAAGFTVNGSPIGGGGGLPDGGYTYGWNITAADFIATSDERIKDNITTAPVGLIDSLKGREWDWKESGEKGSGVVAQELEQVLPHLVHEDDEGMKSVSYNGLVAYLIEEVKALKAEVEELKS